ncbi:MAG: NADP-dependent oxidoreductase [Geminicoccaceae bacterium]
MSETQTSSRRVLLVRRPNGPPVPEDFRLDETSLPPLRSGEVLVRTIWLSLDPYMRGRMNDAPSYVPPTQLGEPMPGECVGQVEASRADGLAAGEFVRGYGGWQNRFALPADKLTRLDPAEAPLSTALGVLGMPGHTAYAGVHAVAKVEPGETVVVGAASGAVGAIAGQLARIAGCRVVGVAGGPDKCRYVSEELGFDVCLDRREPDLAGRLKAACPDGVDVYIELVGGDLLWSLLPLLNLHARISVIGAVAWYNLPSLPESPDRSPLLWRTILTKRLRVEGTLVYDFAALEPEFRRTCTPLVHDGKLKFKEDVVEGLENAPQALIGLLEGRNVGKLLVQVAPDPTRSGP